MLEFETEPESLQLFAHSEKHPRRTYWIDERENVKVFLEIDDYDRNGMKLIIMPTRFDTLQLAFDHVNYMEKRE